MPAFLVHGNPDTSRLWERVIDGLEPYGEEIVAADLPGFGASDKPLGVRYGFELFDRMLDGFLAKLGIVEVGLAVHDLGGPIGLHWAVRRPQRLTALGILNTLVYPEFSEAVLQFIKACSTPELRDQLTSPDGLAAAMGLGLADESHLTDEVLTAVREPFRTAESRRALADAGIGLEPEGFVEIARLLPSLGMPVRVIYGTRDRILPDVAETMARVKADLPQAEVTALPECGHFLQEEAPEEIGTMLARFFAG